MANTLMILPARDPSSIRLLRVPPDFEVHEAYRHVTAVIARVEEHDPDYTWEDIEGALEERGFEAVEFMLGPELD